MLVDRSIVVGSMSRSATRVSPHNIRRQASAMEGKNVIERPYTPEGIKSVISSVC